MEKVKTNNAPAAVGPYSQAIDCGDYVFCSGAVPLDPATGAVVGDTVEEQAHRTFQNLGAVLRAAGLNFPNVVKTTVFIKNMADFAKVNEIYATYFTEPYPARSCVEVSALPKGVQIECECIAKR